MANITILEGLKRTAQAAKDYTDKKNSSLSESIMEISAGRIRLESGTYSDSNGTSKTSNVSRIRNASPVPVTNFEVIYIAEGYSAYVFLLDENKTKIATLSWRESITKEMVGDASYINFAIRYTNAPTSDISDRVQDVMKQTKLKTKSMSDIDTIIEDASKLNAKVYDSIPSCTARNLYSEEDTDKGKYDSSGTVASSATYDLTPIYEVPSGMCIVLSFAYSKGGNRVANGNGARYCTVYNADGSYDSTESAVSNANKYFYNNATGETKLVRFSVFSLDGGSYRNDVQIEIIKGTTAPTLDMLSGYEPFYGWDEIKAVSGNDVKPYFQKEVNDTVASINSHADGNCLVFNLIADNHVGSNPRSYEQTEETLANVKAVNRDIYCDGIIHLGDVVAKTLYDSDGKTDAELYQIMQTYMSNLNTANHFLYAVNGNHDGSQANNYKKAPWYNIAGRRAERYTEYPFVTGGTGDSAENWFYFDNNKLKTRCIFLPIPCEEGSYGYYGFGTSMLKWFGRTALQNIDGWSVIIFAHIAPYYNDKYINSGAGLKNRNIFEDICNAFVNHQNYTWGSIPFNFSQYTQDTKIVAYIHGHSHCDSVITAGQTFTMNGAQTTNNMPCPVIGIGCNQFNDTSNPDYPHTTPKRFDKTVTQDLWDTMVYRPDLHKIFLIRFGAGDDREVIVP